MTLWSQKVNRIHMNTNARILLLDTGWVPVQPKPKPWPMWVFCCERDPQPPGWRASVGGPVGPDLPV